MLTQLSTLKLRLALDEFNVQYDTLLTNAITAISTRFDHECNRTLARTVDATHEFPADDLEILPPLYPIESVTKFELKENETDGWIEQTDVEFLIRQRCIISLNNPLSTIHHSPLQARVTYTGGYVLPGTTPSAGQTPLPADLEQAAVEQVASWFQNRDKLGLVRIWLHQGTYEQFMQLEFLPSVTATLKKYERGTP